MRHLTFSNAHPLRPGAGTSAAGTPATGDRAGHGRLELDRCIASAAPAFRAALGATRAPALRAWEVVLALFFLAAGAAALADVPAVGADFEVLTDLTGAGSWLRVAVGLAQVVGAALLTVPRLAGVGAALLASLMAATAAAYVGVLHVPPAEPALFVAALGVVAYARRASLAAAGAFLERNL